MMQRTSSWFASILYRLMLVMGLFSAGLFVTQVATPTAHAEQSSDCKKKKKRKKRRKKRRRSSKKKKAAAAKKKAAEEAAAKAKAEEEKKAEEPAAFKRETAASFKVETQLDKKDIARTKQADAKRDEAIGELKKLIPKAPADRKAEMIFRLAELYWEKSKYKYGLEMEVYEGEYNQWADQGQRGDPPERKSYLRESELIKKNALKLYEKVMTEYPTYERNDEVLFYLGYNEYEAGNKKKAVNHYWQLIKRFPKSRLVPDSYLQLGEHFFNNNSVIKAQKAYQRATASKEPRIYNYALYKLAWCDYNVQEYAAGIKKLKKVIVKSEKKGADRRSVQLKGEALGDLARFFSYVDETDTAYAYFKKKSDTKTAIRYTTRLGALFHEQGKWPLEIETYKLLIKKHPMHSRAPYLQASIVESYSKMGKKIKVKDEVVRLVDLYRPGTPWYRAQEKQGEQGKAALEYAYDLTESKLRDLVTEYHRDAQKRKDVGTYELARDIYSKYLEAFGTTDSAYQMRFFYAEVLWALSEWKNAAEMYEKVATDKPKDAKKPGKYARTAAYNQILAWEKIVETGEEKGKLDRTKKIDEKKKKGKSNAKKTVKTLKVKTLDKDKSYAKEDIPTRELNLSQACDLYFKIADPKDKDLPAIKFKAAFIYFKHNHFVEAATRYFEMIERWPGASLSRKAANLILDSLSVKKKWDELALYAEKFGDNKKLVKNDKKFKAEVQTLLEGATYKSIQTTEVAARKLADDQAKEQELAGVATRFSAFQKRFPKSKFADKAVYNSVLIYNQADELDNAIAASELLQKEYPKSEQTQKNDWLLAKFYERIADFDTSAKAYLAYYDEYKKDEKAPDALYNAALYYQGLGETKKAIKYFDQYTTKFKKKKDIPDVVWRICGLHEYDGELKKAAKCYDDYKKKFKKAAPAKVFESRYKYALLQEKLKNKKGAVKEYQYLVKAYPKLKKKEQDKPGAQLAGAHAAFELLEPEFQRYKGLKVTLNKKSLLKKLSTAEELACVDGAQKCKKQGKFLGILKYGNGDYGICALTRMGQVYRDVANSIRNAPLPRRLSEDQREIYKAELDSVALGPEEKGISAFERALDKAYELNIYNECALTAQSNLKELNPNKFPDLQKSGFAGAEGFAVGAPKVDATAKDEPAPAPAPKKAAPASEDGEADEVDEEGEEEEGDEEEEDDAQAMRKQTAGAAS